MDVVATGTLTSTAAGADLVITRHHPAPVEEVWAALTEPERTARWILRWSGEVPEDGRVEVVLTAEEGEPTSTLQLVACAPPEHLHVQMVDEHGSWDLEVRLTGTATGTDVQLVQHLADPAEASGVGPGWEYYLDRLGAEVSGGSAPDFEDYHPALVTHYEAALAALDGS